MRLNQPPIEIYIINRIYGSCATTWYCCVRCSSKLVVRIRISLSLASHEASVLYQHEDQIKSPSSPTWEHNGEGFRINYRRVVITFAEVLQMDCWLLLKVTIRKLLTSNEHNNIHRLLITESEVYLSQRKDVNYQLISYIFIEDKEYFLNFFYL